MMDIKVVFCVGLFILSMVNQGQASIPGNPANAFSSASSFGNANAFAGASASASASSTGIANSFTSASTGANPEFSNSLPDNKNFMNQPINYPNNAINIPSTSWMIPPSTNLNNFNPSIESKPSNNIPLLPNKIPDHYTPVISISGTFDNDEKNFNPSNTNPVYSQNYPNNRLLINNNNNYYQPQQYPNQMGYNPSTYSRPNYGNTQYGNTGVNGGYASAGSFANGGVGGYPSSANNPMYPGNNEINVNSRFGPGHGFDFGFPNNGADHYNFGSFGGSNGPNDAWAWGTASAGPSGGSHAGEIGPVGPGIESRFAEDVPSPGGDGSYSSFSSSSTSSKVGPDGKVITTKEVTTGVNNNGKIVTKTIKS